MLRHVCLQADAKKHTRCCHISTRHRFWEGYTEHDAAQSYSLQATAFIPFLCIALDLSSGILQGFRMTSHLSSGQNPMILDSTDCLFGIVVHSKTNPINESIRQNWPLLICFAQSLFVGTPFITLQPHPPPSGQASSLASQVQPASEAQLWFPE